MDRNRTFLRAGLLAAVPLVVALAQAEKPATPVVEESVGGGAPGVPAGRAPCPEGMALIEGDYCPHVEQRCVRWLDPPGKFHEYRCAEYAQPARCTAARVHKRFCIDQRERTDPETGLPLNVQSWTDAK